MPYLAPVVRGSTLKVTDLLPTQSTTLHTDHAGYMTHDTSPSSLLFSCKIEKKKKKNVRVAWGQG